MLHRTVCLKRIRYTWN